MTNIPLWLIPLFPLLGTIILGAIAVTSSGNKKGAPEGLIGTIAVLFPAFSFACVTFLALNMPEFGFRETLCNWIDIPLLTVNIGFQFDALSRIMLLFVTGIGTLITLYSIGYMHGDRGFTRFFAYINLFLFSMIVLVLSDNLMLTFLGWEGVGLCSYLLIGFWNKDLANCKAANKAFIVNRVGDIGFLLGMLSLVTLGGSGVLNYDMLNHFISMLLAGGHVELIMPMLFITCLLFFVGCTGKSAQIPLLTWLPDAMAGPTPVSALIHAATMVTSGVYLVARLSNLFVICPDVLNIILVVGALPLRACSRTTSRRCLPTPRLASSATCSWPRVPRRSMPPSSTCLPMPSSRLRSSSVRVPLSTRWVASRTCAIWVALSRRLPLPRAS